MQQWLVIQVDSRSFGLRVASVREIASGKDQQICTVPGVDARVVGVTSLRGAVISVLDLRTMLGLRSMAEETDSVIDTLEARQHDHVRWLSELENCVNERRPFTLATDPHACAFGRWYDALRADKNALERFTNGDIALDEVIERFDGPHRRIHAIARRVAALVTDYHPEQARSLIDETRNVELATMIELFDAAKRLIRSLRTPMIIILAHNAAMCGLQVDTIESVVEIDPSNVAPLDPILGASRLVQEIAQLDGRTEPVVLLDVPAIFTGLDSRPMAATA